MAQFWDSHIWVALKQRYGLTRPIATIEGDATKSVSVLSFYTDPLSSFLQLSIPLLGRENPLQCSIDLSAPMSQCLFPTTMQRQRHQPFLRAP